MTWTFLGTNSNHDAVEVDESNYYLHAAKHAINASLTQVATAVTHLFKGSKQLFRAPGFLRTADQTRALVWRSVKTNVVDYIIPAILFSYINPALREMDVYNATSDYLEYATLGIVYFYMVRLLARRKETNIEYLIANPRVIKNDVEIILSSSLAEGLATELTAVFNNQFRTTQSPGFIHACLFLALHKYFEQFFKKSSFSAESFRELQGELGTLFKTILKEHYSNESTDFSDKLAQEFIAILAVDLQTDTLATQPKEKELVLTLEEAELFDTDIRKRLLRTREKVKSFLPIVYYPPCKCKDNIVIYGTEYNSPDYYRKVNVANLSSIPYFLLNLIFTYLPEILEILGKIPTETYPWILLFSMIMSYELHLSNVVSEKSLRGLQAMSFLTLGLAFATTFIPPEVFYAMQWIGFLARSLLSGLVYNETVVTARSSHCTRDRTDEINRHKIYAFGIGLTLTTISESLAQGLLFSTGVRNFCTNNAIDEMLNLIMMISTLAYNERLPGTGKNTWNLFFLPQALMREILEKMNKLLQQKPKFPEFLKQPLGFLAWVLLGPNEFYPTLPPKEPKKALQAFLLKHKTIHYLLELFRGDIENLLGYVPGAQTLTWFTRPLSWVAPRLFVAFLVIASKLLNDNDLMAFLQKIKFELQKIRYDLKDDVKIIEDDANQNQVTVAPALSPEPDRKQVDNFEWVDTGAPATDFSKTPLQQFTFLGKYSNRLTNALIPNNNQQQPTQTANKENSSVKENRQPVCRFM